MEKKEFRAESKRLLDLMINSIYTHKEIFLREIISNASDACDKLAYRSLSEGNAVDRSKLGIAIHLDRDARLILVGDNGIGMDSEDLEKNLGVIASSDTFRFKEEMKSEEKETDAIGQFGVGFYSAFMVADEITVRTKKFGSDTAYEWKSVGADGYTITECEKETVGTDVIMHLKPDTEDENYSEFLDEWRIKELVKKYSDYIRFPIVMEVTKSRKKEGTDPEKSEYETYKEPETLNSMEPIWARAKGSVKDEEYNEFYMQKFHDYEAPRKVISISAEGTVQYKALLFIPASVPYDYYTRSFERGLQLYSGGVMIMEKCADLIPEFFQFVRGVVDSPDLSLNISREMLQHDRQLKLIAQNLEKKIKSELMKLQKDDRASYEKFWESFGRQIKYGVAENYGAKKELLQELLMFRSSNKDGFVTLDEYAAGMKEDQKYIYYASGESAEKVAKLPQNEKFKAEGMEVLYFTEEVDEFVAQILGKFKDKEFRSILDGDLDTEKPETEHKGVYEFVKETLGDRVKEVRASARLVSHPVCLVAGEGLSFEMERYFRQVQPDSGIKADRILELNEQHPIFAKLSEAVENDAEKAKKYAELLYAQAVLIAGLPLDDPSAYTDLVCELVG